MLPSHDRFLAVYIAVAIEHVPYNQGALGLSYSPGLEHPNTYNWGWREYGNRVGGFRLLDLLSTGDVTPTVLLNTACYEHCPQLLDGYRDAGAEFVGHGYTNAQHPNLMDKEAERDVVDAVWKAIELHEGAPPKGWMSPGANPSRRTEDLLAARGFRYTLDWPIDDQPTWLTTDSGPLLSIPYPHEINDVPMIVFHHASGAEFDARSIDRPNARLRHRRAQLHRRPSSPPPAFPQGARAPRWPRR
jgi:allantoinase